MTRIVYRAFSSKDIFNKLEKEFRLALNYVTRKNRAYVQKNLEFSDNLVKLGEEFSKVGDSRAEMMNFWKRIQSAEYHLRTNDFHTKVADLIVYVAQER